MLGLLKRVSSREFERAKRRNVLKPAEESILRKKIAKHVRDSDDVDHLIEFKKSGWDVFLTLDSDHLLRQRIRRNLKRLGICVCSPLSLLESFTDYNLMIRTLHGSWETQPIIFKPKQP
jgi:predicted nucleic acid-binding protein